MTKLAAQSPTNRVRVLVWDYPDMERRLGEVTTERPTDALRPSFDALYRWLLNRCDLGESATAILFVPVPGGQEETVSQWLAQVRRDGFAAFARPALATTEPDEMSTELLEVIGDIRSESQIVELLVASHRSETLLRPLEQLVGEDIPVSILGFRERAGFATASERLGFIDVEDVPGAFRSALPRTNLFELPAGGRLLGPLARAARGGDSTIPLPTTAPPIPVPGAPERIAAPAPPPAPPAPLLAPEAATPEPDPLPAAPPIPEPRTITNLVADVAPLTRPGTVGSEATSMPTISTGTIFEFVDGLVRHEPNGVELARIGYQLQQRYPEFDGPAVGYERLADLAAAVAQERNLQLESRNGTPVLRNPALGETAGRSVDRPGRPTPPNGRATA